MNGAITNKNTLGFFKNISTFVFDVDGVLTNGQLLLINNHLVRIMSTKDGYALQLAIKKKYNLCIISGGNSIEVKNRLLQLGIKDIFLGVTDKKKVFQEYLSEKNIMNNSILYMGDDMPDFEVMKIVGLPCCPADACAEIKEISSYIAQAKGGEGCVREVIELVLKLQNNWNLNEEGLVSG